MRACHYSPKTEKSCVNWIKRYIFFHHVRHPAAMGEPEINTFLAHLAVRERVAASTQNQPLCWALLFLYRHVIGREVRDLGDVIRARKPKRLPPVMTREEVKAVHVPSFLCDAPPGVGPRHPDDPGASRPQRRANARRSEGTAHDHTPMSPIAGGTA